MYVVIGGAYSGKRNFVRKQVPDAKWISAYNDQMVTEEASDRSLVLEGFETWVEQLISEGKSDREICEFFRDCLRQKKEKHNLYLIMLEVGRGVVPIDKNERRLRDIMGWIQQSAVKEATMATYIWHGLAKTMKK